MSLNQIFKTKTFYSALVLFLPGVYALYTKLPLASPYPELIALILSLVFILNEYLKREELISKARSEEIKKLISLAGALSEAHSGQKVRANIFKADKSKNVYVIVNQYNMDADNDIDVEIPLNMGVTGEAFRTKAQVLCTDKNHFLKPGAQRLPDEQATKLKTDLEWICSTPIVKQGKVIACITLDGNKVVDPAFLSLVKSFSNRCALLLADLV